MSFKDQAWETVEFYAKEFFEECPDDYCIQHMGEVSAIFGSVNRIVWNVMNGFSIDESYCTKQFIEHFWKLRKEYF